MRKFFFAPLFTLCSLLVACKDSFEIDDLTAEPAKLVCYCMPSATDTTLVYLYKSTPVISGNGSTNTNVVTDADLSYMVNNVPQAVEFFPRDNCYRVVRTNHPGDTISIRVLASGLAPVSASTVIPRPCDIRMDTIVHIKKYVKDEDSMQSYYSLSATFTDDAATQDFYAVKVRVVNTIASGFRSEDKYLTINTDDEPLLTKLSELDDFYGYKNEYYANMYLFNDREISGQAYTLHLNVRATDADIMGYWGHFKQLFRVELYRITPEYYKFLKSLNDVTNNGLGDSGFSQLVPLKSNIAGGIGLLGAFTLGTTAWTNNNPV